MDKVSVVLTFFSNVNWLIEATESVLSQTYENLEVIVVNDCTFEDLKDFRNKYKRRVIFVDREVNGGCAAARNSGIVRSTGDYIAFMDSDDIWFPDKIEKQIDFMKKVGAVWSHTGFYYWDYMSNRISVVDVHRNFGDVYPEIMISFKISHPSVIINKEWFSNNLDPYYYESARYGQDTILFSRIAKKYPLALVEEPLMKVRIRGTNSNRQIIRRIKLKAQFLGIIESGMYQDLGCSKFHKVILSIYCSIYNFMNLIFKSSSEVYVKYIYAILAILPYIMERLYRNYIDLRKSRDSKFILPYNKDMNNIMKGHK